MEAVRFKTLRFETFEQVPEHMTAGHRLLAGHIYPTNLELVFTAKYLDGIPIFKTLNEICCRCHSPEGFVFKVGDLRAFGCVDYTCVTQLRPLGPVFVEEDAVTLTDPMDRI